MGQIQIQGTPILARPYLCRQLRRVLGAVGEGVPWYCAGRPTREGHPRHPLWLPSGAAFQPFPIRDYVAAWGGGAATTTEGD